MSSQPTQGEQFKLPYIPLGDRVEDAEGRRVLSCFTIEARTFQECREEVKRNNQMAQWVAAAMNEKADRESMWNKPHPFMQNPDGSIKGHQPTNEQNETGV